MGKSKTLKKERKKKSARNGDHKANKELKQKLISRIKEHKKMEKERERQQRTNNQSNNTGNLNPDSLQHDLTNSLDYLQSLSAKHKSKKEKRRERKLARRLERQRMQQQQQQQQAMIQVQQPQYMIQQPHQQSTILNTPLISIPNTNKPTPNTNVNTPHTITSTAVPTAYILNDVNAGANVIANAGVNSISTQPLQPDPPYGILKNGKKPLFSIYNKTLKKPKGLTGSSNVTIPNLVVDNTNISPVSVHTDQFFERQQKLNQLKQQMANVNNNNNLPNATLNSSILKPGKTLKKMKQLKTTTKRFIHLGKKNGRVGVLIKNQKTRKKILKDTHTLKKRPLSKIKHYLRKHNLIKIGSTAPEHIIRSIYENSFLSGDVYNKNVDTLLHNYMDT
jgi:hypothetical protein